MSLEGVNDFIPLTEAGSSHWLPITDFRPVWPTVGIPVSGSEILPAAHHFPVVVSVRDEMIRVETLVRDSVLIRPSLDHRSGRPLREYMPLLLRSLPFRLISGADRLEIMTSHLTEKGSLRLFSGESGRLDQQVESIRTTLLRREIGLREATQAACLLFASGLLSPIHIGELETSGGLFFSVDVDTFSRLEPLQVVALGYDGFAAFDLAAACIFSRQFLKPQYRSALPRNMDIAPASLTVDFVDQLVRNVGQLDFVLDEDQLIEIDGFDISIET